MIFIISAVVSTIEWKLVDTDTAEKENSLVKYIDRRF